MLLFLGRQFVLLRTVHRQLHDLVDTVHLLESDALFFLSLLDEDVAGDEGESGSFVAVSSRPAHAVDVGSGAHLSLPLGGLAVVDDESDSADVDTATDGFSSQQNLYFFVAQHGYPCRFGCAAVFGVQVLISGIACGCTTAVDVVDVDIILASL